MKVKGASAADNGFVQDAIDSTKDVTGNDVQTVYTDGAYQSKENRKFAENNGIEFIANGIQGKPSRFDLDMTDEATMFQYSFHTRNNKTRYRTKIKHTLQAIARCAWINMCRLFLYDLEMGLQMATK